MTSIPRPRVDAIDVAHYQIVTDEAAIPHLPVMTCKGSEGATYRDPTRPNWIRIFRDRAEIMGMYHWVRSDSPLEGQVQNLAACYREEGALPSEGALAPGWIVQLDWERTYKMVNGVRTLVRDLTVAEIERWHEYADHVFGPGRVVTYGSDWVPNFSAWRQRNPDKPVWYANYSLSDLPSGGQQESAKYEACLWQWSSQVMVPGLDTASRPGIDVSEILNVRQLRAAAHLSSLPFPPEDPVPLPPPTPTLEDDMPALVTNTARTTVWAIRNDDGFLRQISPQEFRACRTTPEVWSDAELAQVPEYTGPPPLAVDYQALAAAIAPLLPLTDDVARDMAARNATAISDIRMGGQRIADAGGH